MDSVVDFVTGLATTPWSLVLLFALAVLDGFFPPVPSEIALTALVVAATTGGEGPIDVVLIVALAVAGAMCGDLLAHILGRRVGAARLARRFPRLRRPLTAAARAFTQHGPTLLVSARFIPGWRVAMTMSSGVVGMRWQHFLAADLVSATLWGVLHGSLAATSGTLLARSPLAATAVGVVLGTLIGAGLGHLLARRRDARLPDTAPRASVRALTSLPVGTH